MQATVEGIEKKCGACKQPFIQKKMTVTKYCKRFECIKERARQQHRRTYAKHGRWQPGQS